MNTQVAKNSVITLDYHVTDPDGEVVDEGREPLIYLHGGYDDIFPLIEEALIAAKRKVTRPRYAGRTASASPATGLASRHTSEQGALISHALGTSVRTEIRRRKKS